MTQILWQGADVAHSTRALGSTDWQASGLAFDWQTLKRGDLFVALGAQDEADCVLRALANGAAAALTSVAATTNAPILQVADTRIALQDLAYRARARAQGKLIAVAGGTTAQQEARQLRHMLAANGRVAAPEDQLYQPERVTRALAQLPQAADYGIFTLGQSESAVMQALAKQLQPHVAMVSGAAVDGLSLTESASGVFRGMNAAGIAVLPCDTRDFARLIAAARTQGIRTILSFGAARMADACLVDYRPDGAGGVVQARLFGKSVMYRLGTPGLPAALHSLGSLLAAHAAGADLAHCLTALTDQAPAQGLGAAQRLLIPGGQITLIDNSASGDLAEMRAALLHLGQIPLPPGGRRIAALGALRLFDPTAPQRHAALAETCLSAGIDQIFSCGHLMEGLHAALPPSRRGHYARGSDLLAPVLAAALRPGDAVLVQGPKSVHMERVIAAIKALTERSA